MPDPIDHGWINTDGRLEPWWSDAPIMPQKLVDIVVNAESDQSEDESEDELDIDEMTSAYIDNDED